MLKKLYKRVRYINTKVYKNIYFYPFYWKFGFEPDWDEGTGLYFFGPFTIFW